MRSETPDRSPIHAGQAAYWETDEWHEAGSTDGITVIVIEGDALDPGQFMREETL